MVRFELELDLNKLTDEELEAYLKLKKKSEKTKELKKEDSDRINEIRRQALEMQRLQEPIVDEETSIVVQRRFAEKTIEIFQRAYREVRDGETMSKALENHIGYQPNKETIDNFREWCKKEKGYEVPVMTRKETAEYAARQRQKGRKRGPTKKTIRRYEDAYRRLINDENLSISVALTQAYGYKPAGTNVKRFRKWAKEKYGKVFKLYRGTKRAKYPDVDEKERESRKTKSFQQKVFKRVKELVKKGKEDTKEVRNIINQEFDTNYSRKQIYNKIYYLKKQKGITQETEKEKEKKTRYIPSKKEKISWFKEAREKMKERGISFKEAYESLIDREISGTDYKKYKKWCREQNIDPMIKGVDFEPDLRRKRGYLAEKNEFLKWKNPIFSKVMKEHNLNLIKTTKYLSNVWKRAGKNPEKATEIVKKEIETGIPLKKEEKKKEKPIIGKRKLYEITEERFEKAYELLIEDKDMSISKALEEVYGYKPSGIYIQRFKKWAKKEKGKEFELYRGKEKEKEFPDIEYINSDRQKILLKSMLRHIIGQPELTIGHRLEGYLLEIEGYRDWVNFCKEFAKKTKEIAEYYEVKDKFQLVAYGEDGLKIKYRGMD